MASGMVWESLSFPMEECMVSRNGVFLVVREQGRHEVLLSFLLRLFIAAHVHYVLTLSFFPFLTTTTTTTPHFPPKTKLQIPQMANTTMAIVMARASLHGPTVHPLKVSFRMKNATAMASITSPMAVDTLVSMLTTVPRDMVASTTRTGTSCLRDTGKLVNSVVETLPVFKDRWH